MNTILRSHGSGKGLNDLLDTIVLPALFPSGTAVLEDAAVLDLDKGRIAFTTDSFVIDPLEFPGGDIGKLAACGTINDLAMMGAVPGYLSVSLICEEGLDAAVLSRMLGSLRAVCVETGVAIVCGDTKVVEHGKADRLFINTAGIGTIPTGRKLTAAGVEAGDAIIVSGPIGQHGIAVLAARKGLGFASSVASDCAPLNGLVEILLSAAPGARALRDATRGGCAAVLTEIAKSSDVTIVLDDQTIPVSDAVRGACSYLGIDPLQVANEGRFVAAVPADQAAAAVKALNKHELGCGACVIGAAQPKSRFPLLLKTSIGGIRPIDVPSGELLPRIC